MTHTIEVRTANPYQVVVGHGLFDQVVAHLPTSARRVAVIHPRALRATGEQVRADLTGPSSSS